MPRTLLTRTCLMILMVVGICLTDSPATGHGPHSSGGESDSCLCAVNKVETGWCMKCKVGYVGSTRVPSADLFDMIDPHGHDLDPAGISCSGCLSALKADTFCDPCGIGYVDDRAYVSRLAYLMANEEPEDSPVLKAEFDRLNVALEWLSDCELCGVASYVDGRCPTCRIHFKNGVPVNSRQTEKDDSQ